MDALALLRKLRTHSVARNGFALLWMQVANYIAPLLVLPYLTRVLGVEGFGQVMVALAACQFAYTLTDYGFSLSATNDISLNRDDPGYLNRKVGAVWLAKLPLVVLAVAVVMALPYFVPGFAGYRWLFAAATLAVVGQAYQPIWLFLGIERMKNVTFYMVATKVLYVVLVYSFVHTADEMARVVLCWGVAQLLGLAASVHFMHQEGVRAVWPTWRAAWRELRTSAQFFWSRLAVALYTSANTMVVGAFGATQAAHYSACEQIYNAGKNVTSPINTAMFPYMAKNKDWRTFFTLLAGASAVLAVGCAVVAYWAGPLLALVYGEGFRASAPLLQVFTLLVLINYIGVSFGYSAFAALGRLGTANLSVILGVCIQVAVIAALYGLHRINAMTMGLTVLVTESFVMVFRVCFVLYYRRGSRRIVQSAA